MGPNLWFDVSSDEEVDTNVTRSGQSQSPWEFASYSETVLEEHARKKTTSVDAKITKSLQERPVSIPDPTSDSDGENEEYKEEMDDVLAPSGKKRKKVRQCHAYKPKI